MKAWGASVCSASLAILVVVVGSAGAQVPVALTRPSANQPLCLIEGVAMNGWSPTVRSGNATRYWSVGLPPGLSQNVTTGLISGTPRLVGTFTAQLGASNPSGDSSPVDLPIIVFPAVGSPPSPSHLSFPDANARRTVVGSGQDPSSRLLATNLPAGVSVSTTEAALIGTPTQIGHHVLNLTLTNVYGQRAFPRSPVISVLAQPWTAQTVSTVLGESLTAIAFNGSLYVAVGQNGLIWTSPDLVTWTKLSAVGPHTLLSVIFAGNQFLATSQSGSIMRSADGMTWTAVATGVSSQITGVAYGNGLYVAVGSGNFVYSSPDAVTWTARRSFSSTFSFQGIVFAGGLFVACGNSGQILTSPDGITWTSRTSGTTAALTAITHNNGRFVAVGGNAVLYSEDGITWSPASVRPSTPVNFVTSGAGLFLATTTDALFTSTDGNEWVPQVYALGGNRGIFANGRFVFVAGEKIHHTAPNRWVPVCGAIPETTIPLGGAVDVQITASNSPISYTAANLPPGVSIHPTSGRISGTPTESGVYEVRYYASNNAGPGWLGTWTVRVISQASDLPFASNSSWDDLPLRFSQGTTVSSTFGLVNMDFDSKVEILELPPGWAADRTALDRLVITGSSDTVGVFSLRFRLTNARGSNEIELPVIVWSTGWTHMLSGPGLRGVEFGNGIFVGINSSGQTFSSTDGATWTNQGTWGSQIKFAGDRFLQFGANGFIATSVNGIDWTRATTNSTSTWFTVTGGGGRYVAASRDGSLIWSSNGVTWQPASAGVPPDWRYLEYFAGRFWAGAFTGEVYTSTDAQAWVKAEGIPESTLFMSNLVSLGDRLVLERGFGTSGPWSSTDGLQWAKETMTIDPAEVPNSTLRGTLVFAGNRSFCFKDSGKIHIRDLTESTWKEYRAPLSQIMSDIAIGNGVAILTSPFANESNLSPTRFFRQADTLPPLLLGAMRVAVKGGEPLVYQCQATNSPTRFRAFGLPEGLVMDEASGTITGSPAVTDSLQSRVIWIVAENAAGLSEPKALSLQITPPTGTTPGITSSAAASATKGRLFDYKVVVGNIDHSTQITVSNLPEGITYNSLTGFLSGTVAVAGTYEFQIRATNVFGETTQSVVLTVRDVPWTVEFTRIPSQIRAIHFADGMFVSAADDFLYSANGRNWATAALTNSPSGSPIFSSIAHGNGRWLAIANTGAVATATSPESWSVLPGVVLSNCLSLTFGNGLFVAVCTNGIFTSVDGTSWSSRYANSTDRRVRSVAFANGVFVAVGVNETILRSEDAITWTLIPRPQTGQEFPFVRALNGEFVVCVSNQVLRSTDGLSWVQQTHLAGSSLQDIAFGAGSYIGVLAGGEIMISYDLINWEPQPVEAATVTITPRTLAFGNGLFVAAGTTLLRSEALVPRVINPGPLEARVGQPFQQQIASAGNPTSFTVSGLPAGMSFNSLSRTLEGTPQGSGDYSFVITARNGTGSSNPQVIRIRILEEDGPLPELSSDPVFIVRTALVPSSYQITARNLTANSQILVSGLPSGLTYDAASRRISGIAASPGTSTASIRITNAYGSAEFPLVIRANEPGWFSERPQGGVHSILGLAVGNGITVAINSFGSIFLSSVRGEWSEATTRSNGVTSVSFGNGVFVAVGASGRILTSADGRVWTQRTSGVTQRLNSVSFANNVFLVAGDNGILLSSSNGVAWNTHSVGTTIGLRDATFANGLYIVVGNSGNIRTSPNLTTWTSRSVGSGINLFAIAVGNNGRLVTVGTTQTIYTSNDGITWTAQNLPWTSTAFVNVGFADNRFILLLEGSILHSVNGTDWTSAREEIGERFVELHASAGRILVGTNQGFVSEVSDIRVPSLLRVEGIRGYVGEPLVQPLIATNSPNTYGIEGLPAGLQFDSVTARIWGTPLQPGRHIVTVRAANAFGSDAFSFPLEILESPRPFYTLPQFSVVNGQWFSEEVIDMPDGSVFSGEDLPEGLSVDPVTGRISGYPSKVGRFFGRVRATHPNRSRVIWVGILVRHPAPVIVSQPSSIVAPEGANVVLSAEAAGGGSLAYRWKKNGQAVVDSGAVLGSNSSTLQVRNLRLVDAGQYELEVTNESGSTKTAVATIDALQTFEGWAKRRGLPPGNDGPLDKSDFLNTPNLIAFAFGLSPTAASHHDLPRIEESAGRLFYRFKTAERLAGIRFVVEGSTNLRDWSSQGLEIRKTSISGGFDHWEVQVPESGSRMFFRVRVLQVP